MHLLVSLRYEPYHPYGGLWNLAPGRLRWTVVVALTLRDCGNRESIPSPRFYHWQLEISVDVGIHLRQLLHVVRQRTQLATHL